MVSCALLEGVMPTGDEALKDLGASEGGAGSRLMPLNAASHLRSARADQLASGWSTLLHLAGCMRYAIQVRTAPR